MPNRYGSGRALPAGSRLLRLWSRIGLSLSCVVLVAGSSARVYGQFPPPARPPKTVTELPTGNAVKSPAPAELPSARSILDKHVEAIGGRQAVLSHSSTFARGSLSIPAAGITGTLEVYAAKPNRTLVKSSIPGVGELVEGFDGTHGWTISPLTGPMLLEGKALEDRRVDAEFHAELRTESRYTSMSTLEIADFDGRRCYKVRLVRKTGREDIEFYDVSTALKAGSITSRETPMGLMTVTTVEKEYRRFGNLLHATVNTVQAAGAQQVVTITSVEYDSVPSSVFAMPTEIKALLK